MTFYYVLVSITKMESRILFARRLLEKAMLVDVERGVRIRASPLLSC
jgi:hypothetical protein